MGGLGCEDWIKSVNRINEELLEDFKYQRLSILASVSFPKR